MIEEIIVNERGRLRDRPFLKKRKRCKRVGKTWKWRQRKDEKLILLSKAGEEQKVILKGTLMQG